MSCRFGASPRLWPGWRPSDAACRASATTRSTSWVRSGFRPAPAGCGTIWPDCCTSQPTTRRTGSPPRAPWPRMRPDCRKPPPLPGTASSVLSTSGSFATPSRSCPITPGRQPGAASTSNWPGWPLRSAPRCCAGRPPSCWPSSTPASPIRSIAVGPAGRAAVSPSVPRTPTG